MSGPLSDIRVLDLTRLLPGGFCSLLLADFGADVVKVEDTAMGDYVRWAPPYYGSDEHQALGTRSALYLSLNRGKRSIRLDLKSDARPRGAASPRGRLRRGARELPPRRARQAGLRLRGTARRQPADRLLRDHRLRADGPEHPARRPRHELPRPQRPARPDGRAGRAPDPVSGADRRPRRRGADGGLRRDGRSARARALGRGPAGGRLDDRRLPRVARDGGGAVPVRRPGSAARAREPQRRDRLLSALRGVRRLGDVRSAGAEVLAELLRGRWPPGPDREAVRRPGLGGRPGDRGGLQGANPRRVARLQRRARRDDRAGARPRRGARLPARHREGDGGRDGAAGARAGPPARRSDQARSHTRRRHPSRSRPRRAHRRGARGGRLRARTRSRR